MALQRFSTGVVASKLSTTYIWWWGEGWEYD